MEHSIYNLRSHVILQHKEHANLTEEIVMLKKTLEAIDP